MEMDQDLALIMRLREEHQQLLREWKIAMWAAAIFAGLAIIGWLRCAAMGAR